MRRAMMIDLDLCVGCKACVTACKELWDSGPGAARDWVHEYEGGSREQGLALTFYPGVCMQCEDHPCTTDCPTGATYMAEDGVVVVDPNVCIGCGNCVSTCVYDARRLDPEKGIVEKCNLCRPLVERGGTPACVQTCLAECRHFGDLDDPQDPIHALIAERNAKTLVTPEIDVRPKVSFAGDAHRERILAHGAVRPPQRSDLTRVWTGFSRPIARALVPGVAGLTLVGGLAANWIAKRRERGAQANPAPAPETPATLPR